MVNEDECARGEPQPTPQCQALRRPGFSLSPIVAHQDASLRRRSGIFGWSPGTAQPLTIQRGVPDLALCCRGDQAIKGAE
jgi:hypothetical protein